jgi:uncharacterized protein YbjQ (UPF0145 family)
MITTPTPGVEDRRIVDYKGIVAGTAIHGINVGKDFLAAGRNLIGGRSKACEGELDKRQSEAMAAMESAAADLGANAIVGVSLDGDALGQGTCSGSASPARRSSSQRRSDTLERRRCRRSAGRRAVEDAPLQQGEG